MLIILYGDIDKETNGKQQLMIDGKVTCGYREYARNFGHIIYLRPQKVRLPWEHVFNIEETLDFIKKNPEAIVWSVKHSPKKDKYILSKIKNKKIYYSCNSANLYNMNCNISLVDTPGRLGKNAKIWFKGKDENYWLSLPEDKKEFDYLLVGLRGDKNEIYFMNRLTNEVKTPRKILWVGGKKFESKIPKSHHSITLTDRLPQDGVRDMIPKAKVGILFTELKAEGFPQTFLEMTMCGVPVVFNINGPVNNFYFHKGNSLLTPKKKLVESAEKLLKIRNQEVCRQTAIEHYSIRKSFEWILKCLK